MGKEYETFVKSTDALPEGQEVQLTIRDLTPGPRKYECRVVKAIVYNSPEKLPGGDILRVRSWTGVLYPQPRVMKIVKEVGDIVPGIPHGESLLRK